MNKDILKHHEWTLEKWCKNTRRISNTGNLYHLKQSEIVSLINDDNCDDSDIGLEGNNDNDNNLVGGGHVDVDNDSNFSDNYEDSGGSEGSGVSEDSGGSEDDSFEDDIVEAHIVEYNDSTKRKDFNDSQVTKYKQNYGNNCFLCGEKFREYKCKIGYNIRFSNKDHWNVNSNDNSYTNLRLLCLNCHEAKTRLQKKYEFSKDIENCEFGDYPWEAIEDS